ncbi:aspartyl protease family protein [Gluconacetobacter diazotrophicus]|uniref:aspartyl protease family protein n=1 Tax=Gluconacetobacter diazotrophicus TaxID=33996 RepID=UPI001E47E96A|nr:aspartyl protease family protein [Gluconacetobacter diazotrophicus]
MVTTYGDYRRVSGLTIPFSIRVGDGSDPTFDSVTTIDRVDINPSVPDDCYSIPRRPRSDIAMPEGMDRIDVPFRLTADNRIIVPVTLNGTLNAEAEFDSGGSLLLQPSIVAALHADTTGHLKMSGGGEGFSTTSLGRLATLSIGGAVMNRPGFHTYAFERNHPDRMLIGLETLQRFVVHFDFDRQVMTLTKPDRFVHRGGGMIVPFHFQDNQPEIFGSIDGIAGRFAVDTGDNGSLLLIAPFARRYHLAERYQANLPYSGSAVSTTHGVWARRRVHTVAFDGPDGRPVADVHDPVTRISLQHSGFDANRDVSGNIGLGILRQFNLTFDYARQRIILEPNHLYGKKDVFNRAGLRLTEDGHAWTVSVVYAGGPADTAGIHVGDTVDTLNGHTAASLRPEDIWSLLTGPTGSTLDFAISTAHGEKHVRIVLRNII